LGLFGGATAATGWNFGANGGIAYGNGLGIMSRTTGSGRNKERRERTTANGSIVLLRCQAWRAPCSADGAIVQLRCGRTTPHRALNPLSPACGRLD
jgi:hypothetical protein